MNRRKKITIPLILILGAVIITLISFALITPQPEEFTNRIVLADIAGPTILFTNQHPVPEGYAPITELTFFDSDGTKKNGTPKFYGEKIVEQCLTVDVEENIWFVTEIKGSKLKRKLNWYKIHKIDISGDEQLEEKPIEIYADIYCSPPLLLGDNIVVATDYGLKIFNKNGDKILSKVCVDSLGDEPDYYINEMFIEDNHICLGLKREAILIYEYNNDTDTGELEFRNYFILGENEVFETKIISADLNQDQDGTNELIRNSTDRIYLFNPDGPICDFQLENGKKIMDIREPIGVGNFLDNDNLQLCFLDEDGYLHILEYTENRLSLVAYTSTGGIVKAPPTGLDIDSDGIDEIIIPYINNNKTTLKIFKWQNDQLEEFKSIPNIPGVTYSRLVLLDDYLLFSSANGGIYRINVEEALVGDVSELYTPPSLETRDLEIEITNPSDHNDLIIDIEGRVYDIPSGDGTLFITYWDVNKLYRIENKDWFTIEEYPLQGGQNKIPITASKITYDSDGETCTYAFGESVFTVNVDLSDADEINLMSKKHNNFWMQYGICVYEYVDKVWWNNVQLLVGKITFNEHATEEPVKPTEEGMLYTKINSQTVLDMTGKEIKAFRRHRGEDKLDDDKEYKVRWGDLNWDWHYNTKEIKADTLRLTFETEKDFFSFYFVFYFTDCDKPLLLNLRAGTYPLWFHEDQYYWWSRYYIKDAYSGEKTITINLKEFLCKYGHGDRDITNLSRMRVQWGTDFLFKEIKLISSDNYMIDNAVEIESIYVPSVGTIDVRGKDKISDIPDIPGIPKGTVDITAKFDPGIIDDLETVQINGMPVDISEIDSQGYLRIKEFPVTCYTPSFDPEKFPPETRYNINTITPPRIILFIKDRDGNYGADSLWFDNLIDGPEFNFSTTMGWVNKFMEKHYNANLSTIEYEGGITFSGPDTWYPLLSLRNNFYISPKILKLNYELINSGTDSCWKIFYRNENAEKEPEIRLYNKKPKKPFTIDFKIDSEYGKRPFLSVGTEAEQNIIINLHELTKVINEISEEKLYSVETIKNIELIRQADTIKLKECKFFDICIDKPSSRETDKLYLEEIVGYAVKEAQDLSLIVNDRPINITTNILTTTIHNDNNGKEKELGGVIEIKTGDNIIPLNQGANFIELIATINGEEVTYKKEIYANPVINKEMDVLNTTTEGFCDEDKIDEVGEIEEGGKSKEVTFHEPESTTVKSGVTEEEVYDTTDTRISAEGTTATGSATGPVSRTYILPVASKTTDEKDTTIKDVDSEEKETVKKPFKKKKKVLEETETKKPADMYDEHDIAHDKFEREYRREVKKDDADVFYDAKPGRTQTKRILSPVARKSEKPIAQFRRPIRPKITKPHIAKKPTILLAIKQKGLKTYLNDVISIFKKNIKTFLKQVIKIYSSSE